MTEYQPDGRLNTGPLDFGVTVYTATIQFSNDYDKRNDANPYDSCNPWHWDWPSLIDEPDARIITLTEGPRVTIDTIQQAVGALRDYDARMKLVSEYFAEAASLDDYAVIGAAEEQAANAREDYCDVLADNVRNLLRALGVTA